MTSGDDLREAVARLASPVLDELRGARIYVTGASGFLGSWMVDLLHAADRAYGLQLQTVLLTRNAPAYRSLRPDLAINPAVEIVEGDIRSFEWPRRPVSHVIHAATDTSAEAAKYPLELASTIVDGTRRVLDMAKARGARRQLFLSSGAVYGPSIGMPYKEELQSSWPPLAADDAYGIAKRQAEGFHEVASASGRPLTVIARCFAFVGPRMSLHGHFAIGNFIRDCLAGQAPSLHSAGQAIRSYLYAADAAVWLVTLLARGRCGVAYNVGSDEAVSVLELAHRVAAVLNPTLSVVQGVAPDGPRLHYVPDITRVRTEFGLQPWTSLDSAIRRTAEAVEACRGFDPR